MKFAIVLCLIFLVVSAHDDHAPDADRHFHENQIPPPNQQPSKEDIQEILKEVFAKIDTDSDGLITTDELKVWLDKIHKSLIDENLSQQWSYYNPEIQEVHSWEKYDPETKETISWELYINSTYPEEVIKAAGGEKIESDDPNFHSYLIMFKRAEKRWKAADENNDNVLVKEEFKNFIHPEESEKTKHILVEEAMDDMDADKNGEVSFEEYIKHMTEVSAEEEKQNPEFLQDQQTQFATYLDKNKDSVLNKEELAEWLTPNFDRHEAEALRMIHDTDDDTDHKLNQEEILKNDEYFLSLVPGEIWRRFADYNSVTPPTVHDEF